MPFGFHLTVDTLPSGIPKSGCRSALAVSGFRLRARLGFPLSVIPRPARHYPRFRIWRPSSERQRDFNPPDLGAAQHTLRSHLPLCPASVLRRSQCLCSAPLPWHRDDRFPRSVRKPVLRSCCLYAGCRPASNQIPAGLVTRCLPGALSTPPKGLFRHVVGSSLALISTTLT